MTVITPEMEKKQEEAMDKFLAKQVAKRYQDLRKYKRGFDTDRLRKMAPGNNPVSTRFQKKGEEVKEVPDWKPSTDSSLYYRCSFLLAPELCYRAMEYTYIPLAKYHARTYKEEEKGGKTLPFAVYLTTTELHCYETKTYTKFNVLRFDSRSDCPLFDRQIHQAKDRTLATCYVDGFLYHKDTRYYVSPEGWTPPPEWGVEDRRNPN